MKTKTQQHTPTPQELHLRSVLSDKDYSPERIEEIVRAVNSHEALLEAAKLALEYFNDKDVTGQWTPTNALREVVAQAEGGK